MKENLKYIAPIFKENNLMVDLVSEKFQKASIYQYKLENALIAKRMLSYKSRVTTSGLYD